MKKKILIVGITLLLITIGLSGCNEKSNSSQVTMHGLLLSSRTQNDDIMFLILENFTFNMFKDFWTNGSVNGFDQNYYANHTFVLTRNEQLILDTKTYEPLNATFDNIFHVFDEIYVTGVIGTMNVIDPDGKKTEQPSIEVESIEIINSIRD
jgi:hypothetical protein